MHCICRTASHKHTHVRKKKKPYNNSILSVRSESYTLKGTISIRKSRERCSCGRIAVCYKNEIACDNVNKTNGFDINNVILSFKNYTENICLCYGLYKIWDRFWVVYSFSLSYFMQSFFSWLLLLSLSLFGRYRSHSEYNRTMQITIRRTYTNDSKCYLLFQKFSSFLLREREWDSPLKNCTNDIQHLYAAFLLRKLNERKSTPYKIQQNNTTTNNTTTVKQKKAPKNKHRRHQLISMKLKITLCSFVPFHDHNAQIQINSLCALYWHKTRVFTWNTNHIYNRKLHIQPTTSVKEPTYSTHFKHQTTHTYTHIMISRWKRARTINELKCILSYCIYIFMQKK